MVPNKSLDVKYIIADILHDFHKNHGAVFNNRSLRLTLKKVNSRLSTEGMSFLTKTLPRLGKAFDKALSDHTPLNATSLRFKAQPNSNLPIFMGEFFNRVLSPDGTLLPDPDSTSVEVLRDILYLFYKYELPYTDEQEQEVIARFEKTESDLSSVEQQLEVLRLSVDDPMFAHQRRSRNSTTKTRIDIVRNARDLLKEVFEHFDPKDIQPRHGPGAVATRQQLWEKFRWTNVSANITRLYPFDEYFCSSIGHVCDTYSQFDTVGEEDLPARVILVPKDSRGPRLISCEPVDYQWVQQGLGRAIVDHVERHYLTKYNVHYTDQGPNQRGALLGSSTGRYATLDLNEASDRVSLSLVRLLFPAHLCDYLEACRSSSTILPDGRILKLRKFAPMGSALCFPILALTVWAILTAAASDQDTRESILVYGDDVIVPTGFAREAMEQLESFGLKINRDKSCISGLFRESCGTDAFKGIKVTPVRLRTVWSSRRSADSYASWIAYANSFYHKKYYTTYERIVGALEHLYGPIPSKDLLLNTDLSLVNVSSTNRLRTRTNPRLQKREYRIWDIKSKIVRHEMDGWSMLLRYFSERGTSCRIPNDRTLETPVFDWGHEGFDVCSYTPRRTSMLVRRWR